MNGVKGTGEERVPSGHHGEAVSESQVGSLTSVAHGSAARDDQTDRRLFPLQGLGQRPNVPPAPQRQTTERANSTEGAMRRAEKPSSNSSVQCKTLQV